MPRSVIITTITLSVLAGLVGFWLGQQRGSLTERVNAVAAEHVRMHGGDLTDCYGWVAPGDDGLRVTCGGVNYKLGPLGQVLPIVEPDI